MGTAIFILRYNVLRGKLLLEMLRNYIGSGMWQTLTETEKQEELFQLKLKEEKIRKENQLEQMAMGLPGAGLALDYNLFSIMGESLSQLEKRITEQQRKADESGMWFSDFQNNSKLQEFLIIKRFLKNRFKSSEPNNFYNQLISQVYKCNLWTSYSLVDNIVGENPPSGSFLLYKIFKLSVSCKKNLLISERVESKFSKGWLTSFWLLNWVFRQALANWWSVASSNTNCLFNF